MGQSDWQVDIYQWASMGTDTKCFGGALEGGLEDESMPLLAKPIAKYGPQGTPDNKDLVYSSGTGIVLAFNSQGTIGGLTLNLSTLNIITDILWTSSINLAPDTESSSENLLNRTLQLLCERLESHGPGNIDNLIQCDRLAVLDVLLLLSVPRRLLEGLDNEGRGGRND